ncbi:BCCT family transporter [Flaviflexus ciconiae]|uniref:BCCT family transporter n=1 Tax=Flaviflexus ciconiae TaxID=2496867 RepID=A0A3S9PZ31_9ACTO|nr:BCCT family transporter [Flaviflexus ciconiae]AZQ77619.1 BCCT family transporter [Flaviflexus ciconiae]
MTSGTGKRGEPPDPASHLDARLEAKARARNRDNSIIRIVSLILIGAVVALALLNATGAANLIHSFRTTVTGSLTWYLVLLATVALIFCLYMALGSRGNIRLGGRGAKREYGNFAWYSMLFGCGQGIGLIFWSVAEPILVKNDNPLAGSVGVTANDGALMWTYFHWSLHAWAIYCLVAICLAISFHNMKRELTFRDAVINAFPERIRPGMGIVIEVIVILATVFGLSTSFAFAAMQLSSGISQTFDVQNSTAIRTVVIIVIGIIAAISVYVGIEKGMKIISETNSILSIALVVGVVIFGPTLYILSVVPQSVGQFLFNAPWMGMWTDAELNHEPLLNWTESWNGNWTVFIWCWSWAFSPFVGSFIARISKGRTLREFVTGVLGIPTLICVIWIGVLGGSALHYDEQSGGSVTSATLEDTSLGLFAMLHEIPLGPISFILLLIATILVGTYYITSLDSGVHALSSFASSDGKSSKAYRTALVLGIAGIALLLLSIGGEDVVGTVQTGTIIGAVPYTLVIILMIGMTVKRANRLKRDPEQLAAPNIHPSIDPVDLGLDPSVRDEPGEAEQK